MPETISIKTMQLWNRIKISFPMIISTINSNELKMIVENLPKIEEISCYLLNIAILIWNSTKIGIFDLFKSLKLPWQSELKQKESFEILYE